MIKSFVFIYAFVYALAGQAADVSLLSMSSEQVTTGDIVQLKIIDSRAKAHFKKYKNKRIGPLLYVIDLQNKNSDLYFDAIVSEMTKGEKLLELEDKFIIKGLNYKPTQQRPLMDFITLDIPIKITQNPSILIYLILVTLSCGGLFYWFRTRKKRAKKKKLKALREQEKERLKSLFMNLKSKENIAQIYLDRAKIVEYFEVDQESFQKTVELINKIQYRPDWPESEMQMVQKRLTSLAEGMQDKRGI